MKDTLSLKERVKAEGDNPLKVASVLYDGAIEFLANALRFAENNAPDNKNLYTQKANDIIIELDSALNMQSGGDVSKNLKLLYSFMNRQLVDAATNTDIKEIADVKTMMNELRDSWRYIDASPSMAVA